MCLIGALTCSITVIKRHYDTRYYVVLLVELESFEVNLLRYMLNIIP